MIRLVGFARAMYDTIVTRGSLCGVRLSSDKNLARYREQSCIKVTNPFIYFEPPNKISSNVPSGWPTTGTRLCHHGTTAITIIAETTITKRRNVTLNLIIDGPGLRLSAMIANSGNHRAAGAQPIITDRPLATILHVERPALMIENRYLRRADQCHHLEASINDRTKPDDSPLPWRPLGEDTILLHHQEEAARSGTH